MPELDENGIFHVNNEMLCEEMFRDINLDKLDSLFPVFGKCTFGLFGHSRKVPRGWKYVNLGMGNHLVVNKKYYDAFDEKTKDCIDLAEYYQKWQQVADEILGR